ncbi:putative toxin-antitoxin system, antitoxin component, Xre family [Lautropia mirabilis ATCC 51599]|uniref:Putative toxin-antitoxin system, antitoxin component, Xre family n=1 Tax=Lautropia mirabilis ATCC 51599 TaxID=887898 RepID=E7RWT4_9BURK|nr:putative toxin-antitoxin system, antitoxin component, Xre family [Lautropia mirabilis ATCC 51599]
MHGKRPISTDTALRLGHGARFWLNLQTKYDMRITVRTLHDKVAPRIRTFQPRHD